jgi:plastocyanin
MKKGILAMSLILITAVLFSACAGGVTTPPKAERVFYVNAIEIKGGTSTDTLAAPEINPKSLEKTFGYKGPGVYDPSNPTKWQVASYQFNPSALTVFQGDTVKLVLFVVNGDVHADRIEDPDGKIVVSEQIHNRGRQYTMSFVAEEAGVYQLRCKEHAEAMRLLITVIPRG